MSKPTDIDPEKMSAHAEEAASLLRVLANAQRLRILCLLVDGEMTVGQINTALPELSQSALSQHLARLRKEKLVHTRNEAQSVWYSLASGPVETMLGTLHGIYCAAAHQKPTTDEQPGR